MSWVPSRHVRLFTAVLPPENIVEALESQVAPHRSSRARWSPTHQWHVTLLFTPAVAARSLEDYRHALYEATQGLSPFPLAIRGGGAFPRLDAARHLIALLDDPDGGLDHLAAGCRRAATSVGIEFDNRPYQPHLTLARVNRPEDRSHDAAWLSELRTPCWMADTAVLVQSVLQDSPHGTVGGAEHQVLWSWALTG